jgi:hypothetical protein
MAITEFEYKGNKYWRITRAWNNQEVQRYVPIGKDPRDSLRKAKEQDETLRQRQRAYYLSLALDLSYHLNEQGQIRGIRRALQKRAGRNTTLAFECRVNVPWLDKVQFTKVSITRHGVIEAHRKAVEFYCDLYGFDQRSELRKALYGTISAYDASIVLKEAKPVAQTLSEADAVADQLRIEIEKFNKDRKRKVISGR